MKNTILFGALGLGMTVIAFSAPSGAAECMPNDSRSACYPSQLASQYPSQFPSQIQMDTRAVPPWRVPAPDRYPGPSLNTNNGGADGTGGQ